MEAGWTVPEEGSRGKGLLPPGTQFGFAGPAGGQPDAPVSNLELGDLGCSQPWVWTHFRLLLTKPQFLHL